MNDLRIGIIGGGIVGQATARTYLEHVREVIVWDILPTRCTNTLHHLLNVSDIIMMCLPTPQKDGMGLDTSALDAFFSGEIPGRGEASPLVRSEVARNKNWVIKSTVPIGTTRRLREQHRLANVVHSPEFLTARCAFIDAQMPVRNIIGYDSSPDSLMPTGCPRMLHCLYAERFPHVPILSMTSNESEAVKLFQNGIFAAIISLWNELRTLADALGLDWGTVRSAILADGRISPSHSQVPGHDGQRGWGGSCLGKDLSQLLSHFWEHKLPANVLNGVWTRNHETDRRKP